VTTCDGITQTDLYKKSLDWVSATYKNPKEVLKSQIENDFIRIEGSSPDIYCINALGAKTCYQSRYVVEISFKDGRYRFDVLSLESYSTQGGWFNVPINEQSGDLYYNKKGELKGTYKYMDEIAVQFNALNLSLKNYTLGLSDSKKKGDW
jgi:hypothetical protein